MRPTKNDRLHVSIKGDKASGQAAVKFAGKLLGLVKQHMAVNDLGVCGPWVRPFSPTTTVSVMSVKGVRDIIRIETVSTQPETQETETLETGTREGMLLLVGDPWEQITVNYNEDSPSFEDGEFVQCGTGGGQVELVAGNALLGWYTKCWEEGDTIHGNTSGASGHVAQCLRRVYHFTYRSYEILSSWELVNGWTAKTPADYFYHGLCEHTAMDVMDNIWSMTYGKITVIAFVTGNAPAYPEMIHFCASYEGTPITFGGNNTWPPGGVFRAAFLDKRPVLFDVWGGYGGTVYFGAPAGSGVHYWKFNPDVDATQFLKYMSVTLKPPYGEEVYLVGYQSTLVYYRASGQSEDVPEEERGYLYSQAIDMHNGKVKKAEPIELVEDADAEITTVGKTMWNPLAKELYIYYWQKQDPPPVTNSHSDELLYVRRFTVGIWYSCYYKTSEYEPCVCWICDNYKLSDICPPIPGWAPVDGEKTVGNYTAKWKVDIVWPLYEYGESVDSFWHTYHKVTITTGKAIVYYPDLCIATIVLGNIKKLDKHCGGSSSSSWVNVIRLHNGVYDGMIGLPDQKVESGSRTYYQMKRWMWGLHGLEYELIVTEQSVGDETGGNVKTDGVGERYIHAATDDPFDENWEAILWHGEDRDEKKILTPVCIWKDAGKDLKNFGLFYGDGTSEELGDYRRAVFMYDKTEED